MEELLRYDTPLQMFERWVLDDIEVGGTLFPRGCEVACCSAPPTATRPVFRDPDRFDVTRPAPDNPHLTFGAGHPLLPGRPAGPSRTRRRPSATLLRTAPDLRLSRSRGGGRGR